MGEKRGTEFWGGGSGVNVMALGWGVRGGGGGLTFSPSKSEKPGPEMINYQIT